MKKFNLFKEIIAVDRNAFLRAVNTARPFGITIEGNVVIEPFPEGSITVFEGSVPPPSPLSANLARPIPQMLGSNYRVVEDDDRVLIKSAGAWQSIIGYNRLRSLYDDTTADGIDRFSDRELERIGWHAVEFGITYRDIVERIEEACEGTVLCIEQADPYQFSGLGFVRDLACAREIAFNYCAEVVKEKLANDPEFSTLSDDEEEAAEFFKVL